MKILRLELFGFKSFKDRTIVAFDQPITAIVGSNGCGKSNVVDALYWVMGDMSPKHLRGSSMTDVIFSGSRDAAALDLAEVSMVLERDPATDPELPPQFQSSNEIQITRRYYRSGESEYLLNKIPCRLRDIQEFFMDTGVGAKAYSIIEQGAIGRMVAQKPEERRVVIEEVAGIMKFKARKAETERKLEHSRANLQRIDDIVKDLQKQLGTLKRQADKAEKFKSLSEELRGLEIRMGCSEWLERSANRARAIAAVETLREQQGVCDGHLNDARSLLDTVRTRLGEIELELVSARDQSRTNELSLKDIENEASNYDARRDSLGSRRASNESQLEQLEERIQELATTLAELEEQSQDLAVQSSTLHTQLEEASMQLSERRAAVEDIRGRTQEARRRLHEEDLGQTRLTEQIQAGQRQLAQLSQKQENLSMQISTLESDLRVKDSERQSTLNVLEAAFATRTDLEASKNQVDEELNQFEKLRHELQAQRDVLQKDLTVTRVRREQLEALQRDLQGVDATSKALALHLRNLGCQEAMLADKVQVPPVLEKAVEAVLGRHLQRVLAGSFQEAEDLRSVLAHSDQADARQGRATLWMSAFAHANGRAQSNLDLHSIYISDKFPVAQPVDADGEAPIAEFAAFSVPNPDQMPESMPAPVEIPGPDGMVMYANADTETYASPNAEVYPDTDSPEAILARALAPEAEVRPAISVAEFLRTHDAVVGPLDRLLENETAASEWLPLVRNVWVVRSREALQEILFRLEGLPLHWVTLDGDVLSADGFLDLAPVERGSGDASVGLVQRKRELQDLRTLESDLEGQLKTAQDAFDRSVFDYNRARERFRELTQQLAALNPDVENHSRFLSQVEAQLARLSEKLSLLAADLEKAKTDSVEIEAKVEETTQNLRESEIRHSTLQSEVENLESELQLATSAQKGLEASMNELQQKAKSTDRELSEVQSRKAASDQERILSIARKDQLGQELEILSAEVQELTVRLEEIQVQIDAQRVVVEESREAERARNMEVETQKAAVEQSLDEVERLAQVRQGLVDQIRDFEQSLAVNDVEIRNVSGKLQEQYQIVPETLDEEQLKTFATPDDLEELADPAAGRQRALQLRQKIDNLGKINMVAAEEFHELTSRYEYLFIQRQDLFDAISQLQEAIDRIDRESRQRFAEAFNAVNQAFTSTFPLLFGGGNAELRLTNPDNMLETGVEIVAQPPGKKLQSVTLLSGGEKALTAVSLIFGIFSIKPSPFCVLDEVDAPLDDANVNRFNAQVRRMAEISQIIMITHHKKTMESADALFGVTMEKPGISKIASAQLNDIDRALKMPPARE